MRLVTVMTGVHGWCNGLQSRGLRLQTLYECPVQERWTHSGTGGVRQIDFILLDQCKSRWIEAATTTDCIGVGKDHRGVKLDLLIPGLARDRKQRGGLKKGWRPMDESAYAAELDARLALCRATDLWAQTCLQLKCGAIENVLIEVAEEYKKENSVYQWDRD